MRVNKETRAILKKELDWLPGMIPDLTDEFRVQVFDLDTLNIIPRATGYEIFRIYLFDENGKKIGEVGRKDRYHQYSWPARQIMMLLFGRLKGDGYHYAETFSENLEQAIERLQPKSWNTQFVLHIDGDTAVFYKVPRTRNLKAQLELKSQEARMSLAKFLQDN